MEKVTALFKKIIAFFCMLFTAIFGIPGGNDNPTDVPDVPPASTTQPQEEETEPPTEPVSEATTQPQGQEEGYNFVQLAPKKTEVSITPISMATSDMLERGINGDGCQWPVSFESSATGDLMLYGTDVAGMFRSLDRGKTWRQCNAGFFNRGVGMFAIDPNNTEHVLALGLSGLENGECFGMLESNDFANTWEPTGFCIKIGGARYLWDGLEFDATSFNSELNKTMDVYYSIPYERDRGTRLTAWDLSSKENKLPAEKAGLYKSCDGGRTFTLLQNNEKLSDGIVKITENGNIFVGNQHGLFRVDSMGNILNSYFINDFSHYTETVEMSFSNGAKKDILKCNLGVTGLDCVGNVLYVQTWDGIYTLNLQTVDRDMVDEITPTAIDSTNYKSENWPQFLCVSPSNPNHMIYQYRESILTSWASYWVTYADVSFDGGVTWTKYTPDNSSVFCRSEMNGREKLFIIDPENDMNTLSFGSDTVMRSDDGGLHFYQVNGISNMMAGGQITFNYHNPDLLMFGAQDYKGAISTDRGNTWRQIHVNANGRDYGGLYGAFASDKSTVYGFVIQSGNSIEGENHVLVVSKDGGYTWSEKATRNVKNTGVTKYLAANHFSSMQSYSDPNVLFAECFRSADGGETWAEMEGCIRVSAINPVGDHEIFGSNAAGDIVVSKDNGGTWQVVYAASSRYYIPLNPDGIITSEHIIRLAYDHVGNNLYAVVESDYSGWLRCFVYKFALNENLEAVSKKILNPIDDSVGGGFYGGIAVDPNSTNVIYTARFGSYFSDSYSLQRSRDGGETWEVITYNGDSLYPSISDTPGAYEVTTLFVHPLTGELYYGSGCYGFGKVSPPYSPDLLQHNF